MNKRLRLYLSLSLAMLAGSGNVAAADEPEPIKIGSILILSGEGGSWGVPSRNGIEMAIEKVNSSGGVLGRKLLAVHEDDHGDAKNSISAFRELTELKGVRFIVGPSWSNLGLPLVEMANSSKAILISPSIGVAKFTDSSAYTFSTWPRDTILSSDLAKYVFDKGYRNVALVGAEQVWVKEQSKAFKDGFENLGGKIAFFTEPDPGSTDVKTEALKIKNLSGVDAVVSTTDGIVVGSLVAKALRDLHFDVPFFSIALDQGAIDVARGAFEGLEFLTFLTPTADFQKEYRSRYNAEVDTGADTAYDAVMLLVQAIREAGSTDTQKVAQKLSEIKSYSGVSGDLKSNGAHGYAKAYAIKKVVGGKPRGLPAAGAAAR